MNTARVGLKMAKRDGKVGSAVLKVVAGLLIPLVPFVIMAVALVAAIGGIAGAIGQEEQVQAQSSEVAASSGGPDSSSQAALADRARDTPVPWQVLAVLSSGSGSDRPSGVENVVEPDDMSCPATGHPAEEGLVANALLVYRCGQGEFEEVTSWIGVADRPNNPDSDHPNGRAVDAMIPAWDTAKGNDLGWQVADFYQVNAEVLGIDYIIWDAQIWTGGDWESYSHPSGASDATLDHLDHVHVSVRGGSPAGVSGGGTATVGGGGGVGPYGLSEEAPLSADEAEDEHVATGYVTTELSRLLREEDNGAGFYLGTGAVRFDDGTLAVASGPDADENGGGGGSGNGPVHYDTDLARDAALVEETYVAAIARLPITGMDEGRAQEVFTTARHWYLGVEEDVGPGQCVVSGQGAPEHLEAPGPGGGTIILGAEQLQMASVIIGQAETSGAGQRGAQVGLMTALQESMLRNLANDGSSANLTAAQRDVVMASLDHPHDGIGSDWDSVNAFQQRPSMGWGTVAELMDPSYAAGEFFERLVGLDDWESMPMGQAAQAVQISAHPDAYDKWAGVAESILQVVSGGECGAGPGEFSADGWTSPVPGATITSGFDLARAHPIFGQAMPHYGTDLASPVGTPILAANDGVVIEVSGCQSGCMHAEYLVSGYVVAVDHGDGVVSTYNHVEAEIPVSEGDEVSGGDQVAQIGLSGNTTGAHLHFQTILDGEFTDPEIVYDQAGVSLNDGGSRW